MKLYIATWLAFGILNLPITVKYGNQQPIGVAGIVMLVIGGPLTTMFVVVKVVAENSPCIFHCEGLND